MRVDCGLGGDVDRSVGRMPAVLATEPMLMMLPPSGPKSLSGFLGGEKQAEDVEVELLVEDALR